ncbi:2089_t:CDS:10 [Diversispora eburnea]|uniref:2089_t:CDS:1 n=1 Tax=Diversispora eburnea TaxID=1213867 RepID=A0A9N8Z3P1_9GLOM|nr:2089_t:CDS:10 [Diversispora eburnea]
MPSKSGKQTPIVITVSISKISYNSIPLSFNPYDNLSMYDNSLYDNSSYSSYKNGSQHDIPSYHNTNVRRYASMPRIRRFDLDINKYFDRIELLSRNNNDIINDELLQLLQSSKEKDFNVNNSGYINNDKNNDSLSYKGYLRKCYSASFEMSSLGRYNNVDNIYNDDNIYNIYDNNIYNNEINLVREKEIINSSNFDTNNGINLVREKEIINSVNSDTNKASNGREQDNSIRMLYEYYQITCPKDDTAMDQFCGAVDRYGFVISEDEDDLIPELSLEEIRHEKKDTERSQKWAEWVESKKFIKKSGKFGISSFVFPRDTKFQNRVSKGVPDPWRQPVWYFLLTNGVSETDLDDATIRNYKELLTLPSPHERQIDLDIPRSLHSHIMFRTRYGPGQRSLFNILRAFSNYDSQVGYCQGMTNIVTILLMYYTEENSFVMLTRLFSRCNLHNLYIPGFPALLESFYVQEKLMELYTPKIALKFNELQISNTAYATRWYITLFTSDVVPHHTMLRIWDLMMLYGFDVLYFVAVALLNYHEDVLLSSSFEQIMSTLSTILAIDDDDKLMKKVHKLYEKKGRKQLIDTLKAEYRNQVQ